MAGVQQIRDYQGQSVAVPDTFVCRVPATMRQVTDVVLLLLLVLPLQLLAARGHTSGTDKGYVASFDISPDGKQIVFTADGQGYSDLYLLSLGSRRVRRLTYTPLYESDPSFSPDGMQIVYTAGRSLGTSDHVFASSVRDGQVRQLTQGKSTSDAWPAFSPDGTHIVFTRTSRLHTHSLGEQIWQDADVYVMKSDGTDLHRVTREHYRSATTQRYSPDGHTLIFAAEKNMVSNIYVVDANGRHSPRALTHNVEIKPGTAGPNSSEPEFSPHGKRVLFTSDREGLYAYGLYLMKADGSSCRRVTLGWLTISNPRFTSDGRHILFLNQADPGAYEYGLWEIGTDGKGLRRIADSSLFERPLLWKPGKPAIRR